MDSATASTSTTTATAAGDSIPKVETLSSSSSSKFSKVPSPASVALLSSPSSSAPRRRRFSFWDLLSPGRSSSIKSRRKSPSLMVHSSSAKFDASNIQIPSIVISNTPNSNSSNSSNNTVSLLPNPDIVIIQSPDEDDTDDPPSISIVGDRSGDGETISSPRESSRESDNPCNILTGLDLDRRQFDEIPEPDFRKNKSRRTNTNTSTNRDNEQYLEIVNETQNSPRRRSSSCSRLNDDRNRRGEGAEGEEVDVFKRRKMSMINISPGREVGVGDNLPLEICTEASERDSTTEDIDDDDDDDEGNISDNDDSRIDVSSCSGDFLTNRNDDKNDDGQSSDNLIDLEDEGDSHIQRATRGGGGGGVKDSRNVIINPKHRILNADSDTDDREKTIHLSLLTEDRCDESGDDAHASRIVAGTVEASSLSYSRAKFIAKNRPRLLSHPLMTHSNSSNSFLIPEIQTAPILPSSLLSVSKGDLRNMGHDPNSLNLSRIMSRRQQRRVSLTPHSNGNSNSNSTSTARKLLFMPTYLMRRASQISSSGLVLSDSMVSLTNRALVSFIAEENFAGLQHLLDSRRVIVDDRDENGTTALMVAAQRGKAQFVRALLEHGADINAEDSDNWTPLLFAAKEGHDDIVADLLEHGATVDHRDMGGWTSLMWACYKGRVKTAHLLIEKAADVNAYGNYNVSCLGWAAGRNHVEIVKDLINHGAKVNAGDKYGTTPLIWASRKGYIEIVDILLNSEAAVDACGMTSWTALLVATAGNHVEVVKALLEHKTNLNALDKDGCSSLTIACKEGFHEIAIALINAGAYINISDRGGSSNLIHAAKGGHRSIVEALLKKHADVNVQGKDRKTALYWAVEKSHVNVVKLILTANPELELATKDGDTPLLRATRNRNIEIVSLLLEKRAKVNATDKSGDTCLHIAMRSRSKQIVELFLRNPVNSQLLYRPNRSGETPYNIDRSSAKPIITQLFGSRGLNTQEDFENLLGYNLYSSALADMLSDPTLSMPITVGLFARWGSGKSFLLAKLKEEMKSFARQWLNPLFSWSFLLVAIIFCFASIAGVIFGLSFRDPMFGIGFGVGFFFLIHTFLFVVWFCSQRSKYDWSWSHKLMTFLATKIDATRLVFQVVFCHPPGSQANDTIQALPINFYFTEQTKISSTTGGENSVIQMLGSLYSCLENDYGTFSTRLFRAFRPKPLNAQASWKWRKLCCVPYCIIFIMCFFSTLLGTVLLVIYLTEMGKSIDQKILQPVMYGCAVFVGLFFVANLYTVGQILKAVVFSHRRHLQRTVNKMYAVKAEGYLFALKSEVNLMTDMIQCLDAFTNRQSRMVVIVDGLDSGEQDKVLQVLDAVHILFSDNKAPFIILLAIDPHIISKGIENSINPVLNESNVGGQDYLRNLVHLPFYLQNAALRKVKQVKMLEQQMKRKVEDDPGPKVQLSTRRPSVESSFGVSLALDRYDKVNSKKAKRLGLKMSDSIASSLGTNINKVGGGGGPGDLKKMLLGDDYFSDVNPRSMRRLMNIIHITGRLLKAFNFDFNWHHLSTWVNVTEQWPYRLSWMVLYCEVFQKELDDSLSLKTIFERVRPFIPASKELDPNLGLDRDEKKLDTYLGLHKSSLLVSTLYVFLPFTISLDPQLRKDIQEQYQPLDQIFKQAPGAVKPVLATPPSPYINPSFTQNLRYRQSGRNQGTIPQSSAIQPFYPHIVASNPLAPAYSNMWPFPNPPIQPQLQPPYASILPSVSDSVLTRELRAVKLAQLSVEGVVEFLGSLSSLKSVSIGKYQEAIRKNNITGRVLLCCDLTELKSVLNMTFGDWELFKSAICILRENSNALENSRIENESNVLINVTSPERERPGSGMQGSANFSDSHDNRMALKPNVLEKQITMEDQMISGALELLNDEAKEDARKGEESLSNSTLSPIHSEPEPLETHRRTSKSFNDKTETDVLYVLGTSLNLTAELPDSPTVLRKLEGSEGKSQYSIVNESLARNSIVNSLSLASADLVQAQETPHSHSHSSPYQPQSQQSQQHEQQQQQMYQSSSHLESPGKKRGSIKRNSSTSISRHQSAAGSLSNAVTAHFRKKDDGKARPPKTPDMHADDRSKRSSRRASQNFRIGGDTSSDSDSDESQKPLMSRNRVVEVSIQPASRKPPTGSRTPRIGGDPGSPSKKRAAIGTKDEAGTSSSSRFSRIKTSIFGGQQQQQLKDGESSSSTSHQNQSQMQSGYPYHHHHHSNSSKGVAFAGAPTTIGKRSSKDERYESYVTEDSSEPAMYYYQQQESRGKPWTQYRAPTPLPPFGSEEYYKVIKSSNPSPTTSNESEIGSSPEDINSSTESHLFFPEPPELPESPFPRRIGLSSLGAAYQNQHFNQRPTSISGHPNPNTVPTPDFTGNSFVPISSGSRKNNINISPSTSHHAASAALSSALGSSSTPAPVNPVNSRLPPSSSTTTTARDKSGQNVLTKTNSNSVSIDDDPQSELISQINMDIINSSLMNDDELDEHLQEELEEEEQYRQSPQHHHHHQQQQQHYQPHHTTMQHQQQKNIAQHSTASRSHSHRAHGRSIASSGEENKCQFNSNQIGKIKGHFNLSDPVLSRSNLSHDPSPTDREPLLPPQSNLQGTAGEIEIDPSFVIEVRDSRSGRRTSFQSAPPPQTTQNASRKSSLSQQQPSSFVSIAQQRESPTANFPGASTQQIELQVLQHRQQSQPEPVDEEPEFSSQNQSSQRGGARGGNFKNKRQEEFDNSSSRDGTPTRK